MIILQLMNMLVISSDNCGSLFVLFKHFRSQLQTHRNSTHTTNINVEVHRILCTPVWGPPYTLYSCLRTTVYCVLLFEDHRVLSTSVWGPPFIVYSCLRKTVYCLLLFDDHSLLFSPLRMKCKSRLIRTRTCMMSSVRSQHLLSNGLINKALPL